MDACAVCDFVPPPPALTNLLDAFEAVTGRRLGIDEALTIGERILNLERCFNIRNGLTPEHDDVSERLLTEPSDGPARGIGSRPHMKRMVEEYYQLMGWDAKTGKPLPDTLRRLGLENEIEDIW